MDDRPCDGRNPPCPLEGRMAPGARWKGRGGHRHAPRVRGHAWGPWVSARTGTASAGIRPAADTYRRGATARAAGRSLRATGRLWGVDNDTVPPGRPVLGRHGPGVRHDGCRHFQLCAGHGAEWWRCISTPEAHVTPWETLAAVSGEAGGWRACRPVDQWVPAWGVGKRPRHHARRLVWRRNSATDGHSPWCTSAARPHDAQAVRAVYGVGGTPSRHGTRGRCPTPRRGPPPDWCDAVVSNDRDRGRGVPVRTRLVDGTAAPVDAALRASPGRDPLKTAGVERHQLTRRHHAQRLGRQVKAGANDLDDLAPQRTLAFASDHGVGPPRRLRPRLPRPVPTPGGQGA